MKSTRSIEAVTTRPPAWRIAATPAHTSIHSIITPPNITPPTPLVWVGITICVITHADAAGGSGGPACFFLAAGAGFCADAGVDLMAAWILRLMRALSLTWLLRRHIFLERRLSRRPMLMLLGEG